MTLITLWSILPLIVVEICLGSKIDLTATPGNIVEGVTDTFTVTCSLRDSNSSDIIEDNNGNYYTATKENLVILNSIIIRKLEGDVLKEIARIVTGHPATAGSDFLPGQVSGNLTGGQSDNLKYLTVTWNLPGQKEAGPYSCEINAADLNGDNLKFRSKYFTSSTNATVHDLVTLLAQARLEIKSNAATIQNLIALVAQTNQEKISRTEMHYEDGTVNFQDSDSWGANHEKHIDVKFTKAYQNVPLINFELIAMDTRVGESNVRYNAFIDSRTTTGFRITCSTWASSYILWMAFHWTSYGI